MVLQGQTCGPGPIGAIPRGMFILCMGPRFGWPEYKHDQTVVMCVCFSLRDYTMHLLYVIKKAKKLTVH